MKRELKIALASLAVVLGSTAFADMTSKPQTRIDFNKLIDESNANKNDLYKDMAQNRKTKSQAEKKDKDEVIDFIDVEVGIGQSPNLVDRRYDSVGEARTVEVTAPDHT
jgi:hypothetical protein